MLGILNKNKNSMYLSDDDINRVVDAIEKSNSKRALSDEDVTKVAIAVENLVEKRNSEVNTTAANLNQINKFFMLLFIILALIVSIGSLHALCNTVKDGCLIKKVFFGTNVLVTVLFYLFCGSFYCTRRIISEKNFPAKRIIGLLILDLVETLLSMTYSDSGIGYLNFSSTLIVFGNVLFWRKVDKLNETRSYNLLMFFIAIVSLVFAIISLIGKS